MIAVPLTLLPHLVRGSTDIQAVDGGFAPLRLPVWTRQQQADRWIELWSAQTVGVRLVALTSATRISIEMSVTRMVPADATEPPFPCSVVVTIAGVEVQRLPITAGPTLLTRPDRTFIGLDGPHTVLTVELPPSEGEREVTIWLPHNGATVIYGMSSDAPVRAAEASDRPRWIHHGSSISHSIEAESPLGPWPQQVARALDLELTNLAIAGNAQLDPFVARTIAGQPADIVTLKLGVNTINVDSMRRRAFVPALHGFLDLVRAGHPGTPIVVLTPIISPAIETVPGPTRKLADGRYHGTPRDIVAGDGTLTLGIARELVRDAVEARSQSDPFLWGSDGLQLFGPADTHLLWDGLHPNQAGYDLIASRFVGSARDTATALGEAFAGVLQRATS